MKGQVVGIFNKKKKLYGLKAKDLRTMTDVKSDFETLEKELGSVNYQIAVLKQRGQQVVAAMSKISLEAHEIQQAHPETPVQETKKEDQNNG